jgi:hypothetical protein
MVFSHQAKARLPAVVSFHWLSRPGSQENVGQTVKEGARDRGWPQEARTALAPPPFLDERDLRSRRKGEPWPKKSLLRNTS